MPSRSPHIPKYRHHKARDLAAVRINGHDVYLGKYGSPESRELYDRVVAEWLARSRAPLPKAACAGRARLGESSSARRRSARTSVAGTTAFSPRDT